MMKIQGLQAAIETLKAERQRIDDGIKVLETLAGFDRPAHEVAKRALHEQVVKEQVVKKTVIHRHRKHGGKKVRCQYAGCEVSFIKYGKGLRKFCSEHQELRKQESRQRYEDKHRPNGRHGTRPVQTIIPGDPLRASH